MLRKSRCFNFEASCTWGLSGDAVERNMPVLLVNSTSRMRSPHANYRATTMFLLGICAIPFKSAAVSRRANLEIPGLARRANLVYCKRFALPASAQPSLREGSGTPNSSVGKVRILLKACDRTSSPVLVRCSEAVLLGRFEIQNQDYLSCSVPLEKKGPLSLSGDEHF